MANENVPPQPNAAPDPTLITWYRFVRVLRKMTARLDAALPPRRVNRQQFDLLLQIAFEEGLNQQTCANRMGVTKGNVAQHVSWLEEQGILRREKAGRANQLFLTPDGVALVAELTPGHAAQIAAILALLSAGERRQLQAILQKLDDRLA
jgi:DNA-binding MarR family transcriptional regulator